MGDCEMTEFVCKECGKIENSKHYTTGANLLAHQLCFHCDFWTDYVEQKDRPEMVVIDNAHYVVGDEKPSIWGVRGFAGRKFVIEFFDGRKVTTTNLWYQGNIPERFLERLPDNAKWGNL